MDDLFQKAKLCFQNSMQCLSDSADLISSLNGLAEFLGVLVSVATVVGGWIFWRRKRQDTDLVGNSFDGGTGGTTIHGPLVQAGPDSQVEIHDRHPVDLAVIEDLLKDKASLQSERDSWKEQFEKASEGLSAAGVEEGRSKEEIWKAQAALVTGDTALAESIYRARLHRQESQAAVKQLAETHRNLGALAFLHNTQLALDHYRKSTVLDADNSDGWNQLGLLSQRVGELSEAENAYEQILRLASAVDDGRALKAVAYGNLGHVHWIRGELDQAVEMHEKSLALNTELGRKQGMADNYGNLGNVHKTRGELDQAVEMHEKSLVLNTELGRKQGMANQYSNLGNVHRVRGELDQAVEMYEKSLALNTELGRKQGMASDYGNLGNVHKTRGELDQARTSWQRSLQLFQEVSSPAVVQVQALIDALDAE